MACNAPSFLPADGTWPVSQVLVAVISVIMDSSPELGVKIHASSLKLFQAGYLIIATGQVTKTSYTSYIKKKYQSANLF